MDDAEPESSDPEEGSSSYTLPPEADPHQRYVYEPAE